MTTPVRVRFGNTRKRFDVVSDARVAAFRQMAQALGDAENVDDERAERMLKDAATSSDAQFTALQKWVAELTNDPKMLAKPLRAGRATTFRDVGEDWTDGKLHKKWPDHVKLKRSVADDEGRLSLLYKTIGDVPLSDFTLEDAERAMAAIDSARSSATRRHYAQLISKVLRLAVYPLKIIERSPLPVGFLPKVKNTKAKSFLYPSEDGQLMSRASVRLERRLLYGFLAREGLRVGEAMTLRWRDFDLVRGTVTLDENKTDDPRAWVLSAGVKEALAAFKSDDVSPEALVFTSDERRAAQTFREDLREAKIERPEIFDDTASRKQIRVHDLRATFVTLSLAAGRSEAWVADRTGHKSSVMINKYRRQARQAAELKLGELAPLHNAIPELAPAAGPDFGPADPLASPKAAEGPSRSSMISAVPKVGLEPTRLLRTTDFESAASANSATSALWEGCLVTSNRRSVKR